jgi:UPF0755 protein
MNDILPPRRPPGLRAPQPAKQTPSVDPRTSSTVTPAPSAPKPPTQPQLILPKKKRRPWLRFLIAFVFLLIALAVAAYFWYQASLSPVDSSATQRTRVSIAAGSSPSQIANQLQQSGLIRHAIAFDIYTRLSGTRGKLQAGTYSLSPSESLPDLVTHLISGKVDTVTLTFLPGARLDEHKRVLLGAGYDEAEVTAALAASYDHPLFASKPSDTDLEGYIYGETYTVNSDASVKSVLVTTFNQYYKVIQEDGLIEAYRQRGLSLYEGITLASIIQREVAGAADQKRVAQVFFKRLALGMSLGADATYQYAARKLGVSPTPDLNSPYNTRKYAGLPPGPIASPGRTALQAVAQPASGEYLYFVSGDDNVNYFSYTDEEHLAKVRQYCRVKCSTY